jgi:phage tail tape-measure protein
MPGLAMADPTLAGGGGIEGTSTGVASRANQGLAAGAYSQSERAQFNAQVVSKNKAGNAEAGAAAGAAYGTTIGPWGTVIGGIVGGIAGGFMHVLAGLLVGLLLLLPVLGGTVSQIC